MNKLLSCSLLIFIIDLHASDAIFSESSIKEKSTENFNSDAEDYEGSYCGFGLSVGSQRTSATGNREFKNVPERAYSTTVGGIVAVGYQRVICGNFLLGCEIGVDFGSGPKKLKVGGQFNESSASFHYLQRQYALSRLINSYFRTLSVYSIPASAGTSVTGNVWRNFLKTNRYLGGATNADIPGLVSQTGAPGPAISDFINGNYSPLYVDGGNNPDATFLSFIGQETANSLLPLGNGNISSAMAEIRNFIVSANPNFANVLRSIGKETFKDSVADSSLTGTADSIDYLALRELAILFSGDEDYFADIGVTDADASALFDNNIERVNNAIAWAVNNQSPVIPQYSDENIKTTATFNVSPYIAAKAGYFFNEIKACLYIKAGAIQLVGQIVPVSNFYTIKNDKFRKAAPFFAIGFSKNFNENFGISFEVSRTLEISKDIAISTPYLHTINNKAKIDKTSFAIIVTYRL